MRIRYDHPVPLLREDGNQRPFGHVYSYNTETHEVTWPDMHNAGLTRPEIWSNAPDLFARGVWQPLIAPDLILTEGL